jgi:hypothetical protein|tara:strand:+ start:38470 stop:38832 length:363 start_codon:yes stop_codon:yes gene_type:complete
MAVKTNARDEFRTKFFNSRNFKKVTIQIWGMDVELRQMSLGDTISLMKGREDVDLEVACDSLIRCAFVPGTEEHMFDEIDREQILAAPMDDWVRALMDGVGQLMGGTDVVVAEKNSEETT